MSEAWKPLSEWLTSGPKNGTEMLVLLPNGKRCVAYFNGLSLGWFNDGVPCDDPIAWCPIPNVPPELHQRIEHVRQERARLDYLERSPLEISEVAE